MGREPQRHVDRTPRTFWRAPGEMMTTRQTAFEAHRVTIMAALRAGASRVDAAREAGIASRTIDRWVARGRRDPDSTYGPFAAEVDRLREARQVPSSDEPVDDAEVQLHLSRAIRNGSVSAMKVWIDTYRRKQVGAGKKSADPLAELDELAERRRLQGTVR